MSRDTAVLLTTEIFDPHSQYSPLYPQPVLAANVDRLNVWRRGLRAHGNKLRSASHSASRLRSHSLPECPQQVEWPNPPRRLPKSTSPRRWKERCRTGTTSRASWKPSRPPRLRARFRYIDQVAFTQQASVKEGELLFVIDPRRYQAERDRTAADVQRFKTALHLANIEHARVQSLEKQRRRIARSWTSVTAPSRRRRPTSQALGPRSRPPR